MIKLLHTGDIHANKTRAEDVCKLLDFYINEVKSKKIDAVLICGDFWDCAVVNNKEFATIIAKMAILIATVPVYMIYGTPSHEINSSLEVFAQMGAHVTYEPHLWTFTKGEESIDILGVSEPRRSDFVTKSVEETNAKINEYLFNAFNIQHDNPLVVMHHNEISGATMQNGQVSKSETQLTKEMYSQCNPIYIAAAHIHQPQTIDKIIRYPSSPIPCTFGELHTPSYNLVSIDNGKVSTESIKTPFPSNRVIECDIDTFRKVSSLNFKDVRVKVKLTLTAEQRKTFKVKDEARKMQEKTNASEFFITISTVKDVSIRSKEISQTTSMSDKLKIYADVNGINLTDTILQKAKDIEDSMLIKYTYPTHSFELLSLSLRGAKGLTDREEINIDFTKYEQGVLVIQGANGTGKSTLMENCSPYPCLLTRSGALRSHFYLKDSHRIVTYKDENGKYYKFTIQLAAHIDSGLVKYYAETSDDEGATWNSVRDCDGNLDTYKAYVESVMGSLPMYLRTAFFTKGKVKGVNDLASATKGDRIALISELIGTDGLSDMHDMIKEKLKSIGNDMDKFENIEERTEECQIEIQNKINNKNRISRELSELEKEITELESELSSTRKEESDFNLNYAKYGNAIQMKAELEDNVIELTEHLDKLVEHKKKNDFFKNYEKEINEYKKSYEIYKPLQDKLTVTSKSLQTATSELFTITNEYNELKSQLEAEERKYDGIDDRIQSLKSGLMAELDSCPTCGAKLSERKKKELIQSNEQIMDEIKTLEEFKVTQKGIVSETKKKFSALKPKLEKAKETEKSLHSEYDEIDAQFQSTSAYIDMNDKYMPYIDYVYVTNLETDIERISLSLDTSKRQLETLADVKFVDYKEIIGNLESELKSKSDEKISLSMDLGAVTSQIEQLNETLELMKSQANTMKELSKEYEEYSILEQAFSNGGIQALELEAAVPDIASLTNTILQESYGDKFTVAFNTLKQSRNKIIDDFTIEVTNNETGWTTPIELLSEGEKIWVIQALSYALSLIRMQRTGFSFMVRFADESDGALDGEARIRYLNMITSAHKSGGSRLTCLVTHSQEIKDLVNQVIQL